MMIGGHACVCDERFGRSAINPVQKYEWRPKNCSLDQWDSKQFCTLLGTRKILLLGDSTMQQSAATLVNMVASGGGSCVNQITFARSHYLIFRDGKEERTVFEYFDAILPDIFIFTAGAHLGMDVMD